jgi:hypothetical protein
MHVATLVHVAHKSSAGSASGYVLALNILGSDETHAASSRDFIQYPSDQVLVFGWFHRSLNSKHEGQTDAAPFSTGCSIPQ